MLSFFAGIGFEGETIFYHARQRSEIGEQFNHNAVSCCSPNQIANLPGIGGGD